MRIVRLVFTAIIAILAATSPARADIILSYHLSSYTGNPGNPNAPIPNNLPAGPQVDSATGLVLSLGQTVYLQVAITANLSSPTAIGFNDQLRWDPNFYGPGSPNDLYAFGFHLRYPTTIVSQPYDVPMPGVFTYESRNSNVNAPFSPRWANGFPGYNMGSTPIAGVNDLNPYGLISEAPGVKATFPLATFRITADYVGSGRMSVADNYESLYQSSFLLADGTDLAPLIFDPSLPSHYTSGFGYFPLLVTVVPEPSSFILAGCALLAFICSKFVGR
jgi:hypothetical protein